MIEAKTEGLVASPCVRNCCLNEEDICLGCFRTLEEILNWSKLSEPEKIQIVQDTKQRKFHYRGLRLSS